MSELIDRTAENRFEWEEEGHIAFADYRIEGSRLIVPHVEAPPFLRGKGTAGRLMQAVAGHAREKGLKIVPLCSYARTWLDRHPEYGDTVA